MLPFRRVLVLIVGSPYVFLCLAIVTDWGTEVKSSANSWNILLQNQRVYANI